MRFFKRVGTGRRVRQTEADDIEELLEGLCYLAAPYTHPDPTVVEERMTQLCKVDAALMKRGIFTVSPLLKHYVAKHENLPTDFAYWQDYSTELIQRCDCLLVLMLDGWDVSPGVTAEIDDAKHNGLSVYYIDPRCIQW